MNKYYLINASTFLDYEDLSQGINPRRINVFIKKAQDLDLKPFLGHALYYDFIPHFEVDDDGLATLKADAPQHYQNLWNGCQYTDRHGHSIIFEGLQPTLVYFAFARFVEGDAIRYTATGPVVKKHEDADAVSYKDVVRLVEEYRSVANAHCREVEKFLLDHRADFALWHYSEANRQARQPGPRITGIDRTRFNYPDAFNAINYNSTAAIGLNELLP